MGANNEQNEEALNLSCPKKVTFAAEDKCYSIDSTKSFQNSKSSKIPENILNPVSWQMFQANGKSRRSSTPVIFYNKSREASPCFDEPLNLSPPLMADKDKKTYKFSTLPVTPEISPAREKVNNSFKKIQARKEGLSEGTNHFPVIKPTLLNLTTQQSSARKVFHKPGQTPDVQTSESKDEIKRTSSNTREVHNRLEKNRRAHLKACFDELACECELDPRKASNLMVIRSAYKCIMTLRRQEREHEQTLAALVQEKIKRQSLLNELKRELPGYGHDSDSD